MNTKISIIGLGYVGLPLAVEFAEVFPVIGFDVKENRIAELKKGMDATLEVRKERLRQVLAQNNGKGLTLTANAADIAACTVHIVTVPTPIDRYRRPDLTALHSASRTVARYIKKGDVVIYESTVFPGATEEECVPILEKESGLVFNRDFYCGYSPERVNPGDKEHTIPKIKKVTSGSTPATARFVDDLYKRIISAGTHMVSSIRVAEAAKVIENAQRDINIAFVNELAMLFNKLGIDTKEVLDAAATKWNFLNFRPGLVGGHCIGVDPYYLTHKAEEIGYNPEIILSGRRINNSMGSYVAKKVVKLMIRKGMKIEGSRVLVLGITFKENCPDIRNSRVIDIIEELKDFGCRVDVSDPWADAEEVKQEYGLELIAHEDICTDTYQAVVVAVGHSAYFDLEVDLESQVVYDVKSILEKSTARL